MRFIAIKSGAASLIFIWATACFYTSHAVAQVTRESVAEKFYAAPPFATGGRVTSPIQEPALLNADNPLVK